MKKITGSMYIVVVSEERVFLISFLSPERLSMMILFCFLKLLYALIVQANGMLHLILLLAEMICVG